MSIIRENDENHKFFIETILDLPWHEESHELGDIIADFYIQLVCYRPTFKSYLRSKFMPKTKDFRSSDTENWFRDFLMNLTAKLPMIKHEILSSFNDNFPNAPSAIKNPDSYTTYIRISMNFVLKNLDSTSKESYFNTLLSNLLKIDAMLPSTVDTTAPMHQKICNLLDSAICEIMNFLVVYKPLDLISSCVFDGVILKSSNSSFACFLYFIIAVYFPKKCVTSMLGKLMNKTKDAKFSLIALSSFLSHAKVINKDILEKILKKLTIWAGKYIHQIEPKLDVADQISISRNVSKSVESHGHFYAVVHTILQVISLRQKDLFIDDDTSFFRSLNLQYILLNRSLNPLLFCSQSCTEIYSRLMSYFHLPSIAAKLAQNREARAVEIFSSGMGKDDNWNPLDWNDIFSKSHIKHLENVCERFITDTYVEFEEFKKNEKEIVEFDENDLPDIFKDNFSSENESDMDEIEELPVLKKIYKRERTISEGSKL